MKRLLHDLPAPPEGNVGWPWTEETLSPEAANAEWPRITVVTPSFNQGEYIEETLRSVLLQNYPNLEYIVIDGGSSDATISILEKYSPWISYWVSEKDRGQSHAINKGFSRSNGTIRAYLNSDDLYMPGTLFEVADQLNGKEKGLLHGTCVIINQEGERLRSHLGSISSFEEIVNLWEVWWKKRQFVQPEVFWTTKIQEAAGEFREDLNFVMDYEFWCRLLRHGASVYTTTKEFSAFRITSEQKSRQSEAVAHECRAVAKTLLWDRSAPISPNRRALLQRMWLYDARFLGQVSQSIARGEGKPVRWARLAMVLAQNPGILRTEAFWRRARQLRSS